MPDTTPNHVMKRPDYKSDTLILRKFSFVVNCYYITKFNHSFLCLKQNELALADDEL